VIEVDLSQADFLTSERVEGERLSDRLARSRLSVGEAVRYAIEIGASLSGAHRRGQVHGKLSPHAIMITAGGVRILQPAAEEDAAPYRSPEQVRGERADSRSDVFAFGAILYELATGARAFQGSGEELVREILEKTPPPANSPAWNVMEPVISSCLQKNPLARKQRVHNAVNELKFANLSRHTGVARAIKLLPTRPTPRVQYVEMDPGPRSARRFWIAGLVLGLLVIAATAAAAAWYLNQRPLAGAYAFRVELPPNTRDPEMPALSPDGGFLTFSAVGPEGQRMLWLRPLNELRYKPIAGTEGGNAPFWSPDSQYIGFFADRALKKVGREGGDAEIICTAEMPGGGGAWNHDGTILFAPGLTGGLYRVAAAAKSKPEPVLSLSAEKAQGAFLWPQFLPDSKHFLFFVQTDTPKQTGVYVGAIGSGAYQFLFSSDTNAVFSPNVAAGLQKNGYLLFMHDRTLMGQVFNTSHLSLEGDPIKVVEDIGVRGSISLAPVSVSNTGILAYQTVGGATRQMVWLDRTGKQIAAVRDAGEWGEPRVSPDGTRAVLAKLGPDGAHADLWILDAAGRATQLTDTPIHEGSPVWSPTGAGVAFFQSGPEAGNFDIFARPANGAGKPDLLLKSDYPKYPTDWARDGRFLIFTTVNPGTKSDVWALSLPDRHAGPVLGTIYNEGFGALSPDGRWLAFQSDESGKNEVYVELFSGIDTTPKRHWLVSPGGGGHPRWRGDGKELFYISPGGRMMSVAVRAAAGENFEFDTARTIFQTHALPKTWNLYDVNPDGQKFVVNLPLELTASSSLALVTDWMDKLKP
jgi:eukaryotic-like serine/threonine-protein kinase